MRANFSRNNFDRKFVDLLPAMTIHSFVDFCLVLKENLQFDAKFLLPGD